MRRLFSISVLIGLLAFSLPVQAGSTDLSAQTLPGGAMSFDAQLSAKAASGNTLSQSAKIGCMDLETDRFGLNSDLGGLGGEADTLLGDLPLETCGIAPCMPPATACGH